MAAIFLGLNVLTFILISYWSLYWKKLSRYIFFWPYTRFTLHEPRGSVPNFQVTKCTLNMLAINGNLQCGGSITVHHSGPNWSVSCEQSWGWIFMFSFKIQPIEALQWLEASLMLNHYLSQYWLINNKIKMVIISKQKLVISTDSQQGLKDKL